MKIKINHKDVEVSEGDKLIEVLREQGFEIPSLCYAKEKKHQASCMVCVVKNCATGQIIPACSTLVAEGMDIESESDEVRNLRRQALELLLSDHIAVCRPPCDTEHCNLRKYAVDYRAKWNRYPRYSAIQKDSPQHVKDHLYFDVTKCIRCGLCVYNSTNGFTFKNRGFGTQVVLPVENAKNVDEVLWKICPTQALFRKTIPLSSTENSQ